MSSFTDPLDVRHLGGDLWETRQSFNYWTRCDESRPELLLRDRCALCITVPEGTISDFASIPRFLWPIVGHPAGEYVQASVLHDRLYQSGEVSRKEADEIFLEAMEALGVAAWKRRLLYYGVRIGGGMFYVHRP